MAKGHVHLVQLGLLYTHDKVSLVFRGRCNVPIALKGSKAGKQNDVF